MAKSYRVHMGPFEPEIRGWRVEVLELPGAELLQIESEGEPMLPEFWEHTPGSSLVRWKEAQDEPSEGLVAVVRITPKRRHAPWLVAGVAFALSIAAAGYQYRVAAKAKEVSDHASRTSRECGRELKECRALGRTTRVRELARELFTAGGTDYARR